MVANPAHKQHKHNTVPVSGIRIPGNPQDSFDSEANNGPVRPQLANEITAFKYALVYCNRGDRR